MQPEELADMPNFMIFIVFLILIAHSIDRHIVDLKTIFRSLNTIGLYKEEELFIKKCGRLFAAQKNLEDSYTYLTKLNTKYQRNFYFLKYSLLSTSLQEKLETIGCEAERTKYLIAKTRRVKSKYLNKNWPKWVSHLSFMRQDS